MSSHTSQSVSIRMRFVTPAFLGGADQSAELRAAPFKALLRQCWRIANAADQQFNHEKLREHEGLLFGHTWLEAQGTAGRGRQKTWHMKSPLSVCVYPVGSLQLMGTWPKDARIQHPEVKFPVGAHLYLGYGPLDYDRVSKGTILKNSRKAIAPGAEISLRLSGRGLSDVKDSLKEVLTLFHWAGTIGGRSRNGWGSMMITDVQGMDFSPRDPVSDLAALARDYESCLQKPWPHAVGKDSTGLLCWKTKKVFPSWEEAMQELARMKIAVRTCSHFLFPQNSQGKFSNRHFLAYPVTKHAVAAWPRDSRLANQLRFKVLEQQTSKYIGIIFHFPAGLPPQLRQSVRDGNAQVQAEQKAWAEVHRILDEEGTRWNIATS